MDRPLKANPHCNHWENPWEISLCLRSSSAMSGYYNVVGPISSSTTCRIAKEDIWYLWFTEKLWYKSFNVQDFLIYFSKQYTCDSLLWNRPLDFSYCSMTGQNPITSHFPMKYETFNKWACKFLHLPQNTENLNQHFKLWRVILEEGGALTS